MSDRISYRRDIDGLRAIAVLIVVLGHAELGLSGGYIGVDVFFVISGYLITALLLKDLRSQTFSLAEFWERRIRRIMPALSVMTIACLVAGWFLLSPADYMSLGKSAVALTLLSSNFHFWRDSGYFAPAAETKPLLHTWSLAVEEQFYLLVPVVLWLMSRRHRLHLAGPLFLLVGIGSFALSVWGTCRAPIATFYLLPARTWELIGGALLATRSCASQEWSSGTRNVVATLGTLSILVPAFLYSPETPFPGAAAIPPVLGAMALIWSGAGSQLPVVNRLLCSRPLVFIGLISYSLYLWHWPVFVFARSQTVFRLPTAARVLLVLASLALAAISWRWIETPFRQRRYCATRMRLAAVAACSFCITLAAGLAIHRARGFEFRLSSEARVFTATSRFERRFRNNLVASDIPANLVRLGDHAPQILVWGDSHAMDVLPGLELLCKDTGVGVCAATHAATPPVLNYFSPYSVGLKEEAVPYNAAVVEYVRTSQIRSVILVATWESYLADTAFADALLKTVDELHAAGADVWVMNEVPRFPFDVPKALCLYSMRGKDLTDLAIRPEDYRSVNAQYLAFVPQLLKRGVRILDPLPLLQARSGMELLMPCDAGGSYYRDYNHLSTYGGRVLRGVFIPVVEALNFPAQQ